MLKKALPADARVSLINTIFSGQDKVEIPKQLSREDAQIFVDMIDIDEVSVCTKELVNGL